MKVTFSWGETRCTGDEKIELQKDIENEVADCIRRSQPLPDTLHISLWLNGPFSLDGEGKTADGKVIVFISQSLLGKRVSTYRHWTVAPEAKP